MLQDLAHTSKVERKSCARGSNPSKELLKIPSRPFLKHWLVERVQIGSYGGHRMCSSREYRQCLHTAQVKPDRRSNLMLIRTRPIAHCIRRMFTAKQQDQQQPRQPPQGCQQLAGHQALQHPWRQHFRWPTMSPLQNLSLARPMRSRSWKEQHRPL